MEANSAPDSTPKKILFWDNRANETQRLEEELMTSRIREMEALTELRELRLKVMELETQVLIIVFFLKGFLEYVTGLP